VVKKGLRIRFHPGSETQLSDPLIEAEVGEGRAPAHRGLCHPVFGDLPLADFDNRIPNLTAEITFHREAAQPWQLRSRAGDTLERAQHCTVGSVETIDPVVFAGLAERCRAGAFTPFAADTGPPLPSDREFEEPNVHQLRPHRSTADSLSRTA
jgi:hypothetical protein